MTDTMPRVRTYRGCNVYPVLRPTVWGARWETCLPDGRWLVADTLAGIKAGIRDAVDAA